MMNDQDRRRYDAFVRIVQFGTESAADFPAGSIGKTQFDEIAAVVGLLDELAANKAVSVSEVRYTFVGKGSARENLRDELSDIVETARTMVYQFPGIDAKFRMPRNNNDQQMLAAARAFKIEAAPLNADFIAYGLPATFLVELQSAIDAFEASLAPTGAAIDAQVAATAEIDSAIRRAMIARRILLGVVKNKYRNNVGKLAAWLSASHIEKAPRNNNEPPTA
ncbi:MAG TPA: hypothetical protein VF604_11100 [Pyrinomonadaceae bacterium]|jgi:hypothetical protein